MKKEQQQQLSSSRLLNSCAWEKCCLSVSIPGDECASMFKRARERERERKVVGELLCADVVAGSGDVNVCV